MMAEFAKSRIAKMKNNICYSNMSLAKRGLNNNNKENNIEIGDIMSWFQIR